MKKVMPVDRQGFTIIELLVSVAILGLLVALIIVNITGIRAKNRDSKRMSDMKAIASALSLYNTNSRQYPIYNGNITGTDLVSTTLESSNSITKIPLDPLNYNPYIYNYQSANGTDFTLSFCLETDSINGYQKGCGNAIKP